MGSGLVLADVLTGHEPGRDAFHRVPIFSGEFRDTVECVPTGLNGRFMGRSVVARKCALTFRRQVLLLADVF